MKKPLQEQFISNISVSNEDRQQLQLLQQSLGLRETVINTIEAQITSAYEQKLQQYEEEFTKAIYQQYPLSDRDRQQLQILQESLELKEEVIKKIVARVAQAYGQKLRQYEEEFTKAIYQQYPLSQDSCKQLQLLQQKLGLSDRIVTAIETCSSAPIQAEYQRKAQQYEKAFARAIQRQLLIDNDRQVLEPLSDDDRQVLAHYQQVLNLSQEITQSIEEKVAQAYEQKLQQYEEAFTKAIHQQYPLGEEECQPLQLLQQNLELSNEVTESIATKVTSAYEQKLQDYEKALTWASKRQYPFSDEDREFLEYRRQQLNLRSSIASTIEAKITENYPRNNIASTIETKITENDPRNNIANPIEAEITENDRQTLPELKQFVAPSSEQPSLSGKSICPPLPTKPKREHKQNPGRVQLKPIVLAAFLGIGAIAYYAYIEQSAKANLSQAKTLIASKKYAECVAQAKAVPQIALSYGNARSILNQCQSLAQEEKLLTQAQDLAKKNNFQAAIATVNKIQAGSNLRTSAAHLSDRWSENLLKQAQERYKQAHDFQEFKNALDLTTAIPKTSPVAKNAEEMRQKWNTEWRKNETYLEEAQNALLEGKLRQAIDRANQVRILGQEVKRDNLYWQNNLKPIIEEAEQRLAGNQTSSRIGSKLVGPKIVGAKSIRSRNVTRKIVRTRPVRPRNIAPRIVKARPVRPRNITPKIARARPVRPRNNARPGGFRQENR
ncbi:hypothetical protein [Aliterella atlantica]|uniref:Uncharacterized protein n=1 Tax=Aliterella atlantica CENA595 TaxID=1618023 RepID=A0A0D8ZT62_9CYAN|nr:hypothetical protein [Aliterella atlantica]KJH71953.1 hypothetical protein UH38_09545 [Aliterella atlantica CENA595]